METLSELLARERRSERVACRVEAESRSYDYDGFLTIAWQAGNYLRHLAVREGVSVGIADDPIPEAFLAALGTGLLGGAAWFDPPARADLRAFVGPTEDVESRDPSPGFRRVAYGGETDDPAIARLEEGLWSENPTMPPERPPPETPILTDGRRRFSQRELLAAAGRLTGDGDIQHGTDVVLRAPLSDPSAVVGVLATLRAEATLVFPASGEPGGDVAIGSGPEPAAVSLEGIAL